MRKNTLQDGIETLATTFQVFNGDQWVSDMVAALWDYQEIRAASDADCKRLIQAALRLEKTPVVGRLLALFRENQPKRTGSASIGCARCRGGFWEVETQLQAPGREPAPPVRSMARCQHCNGGVSRETLEDNWRESARNQRYPLELVSVKWGSPWLGDK